MLYATRTTMTKTITTILVALFAVACGGEPFSGAELDAAGGDGPVAVAGAPDAAGGHAAGSAGASRGGATSGGSSSSAGKASGGAATAGAATGGTGTSPVTCDLDTDRLTAALPTSFVWDDYTYTDGQSCTTCRDSPCDIVSVISWGAPQVTEDGRLQYLPNTDNPMVPMNFGTNDGSCTKQVTCGVKFGNPQLLLTVTKSASGWVVSTVEMLATIVGNQCVGDAGGTTFPMGTDFDREAAAALQGLEIPCN